MFSSGVTSKIMRLAMAVFSLADLMFWQNDGRFTGLVADATGAAYFL